MYYDILAEQYNQYYENGGLLLDALKVMYNKLSYLQYNTASTMKK